MFLAKVIGSIVVTQKTLSLQGKKLLILSPVSMHGDIVQNAEHVAVDDVGAGIGDLVLASHGNSAREVFRDDNRGIDCAIVGIIDGISNN